MALYFKFISEKNYDSISLIAPFISVSDLKNEIFASKYKAKRDYCKSNNGLCRGTDFDINVINPETNEEYVNDSTLIPQNSRVLIRRVAGGRGGRRPIDVTPIIVGEKDNKCEESNSSNSTVTGLSKNSSIWSGSSGSSVSGFDFDTDFDAEFGGDVYAVKQNRDGDVAGESGEEDEKRRIEELVNTPALDWKSSNNGVGFGRGDWRVPHAGYVCRRCNVPGHFIQHCPTNGDPSYDLNRSRPPTGIPKSKLAAAVLVPDEAAFDKAMEGIPSAGRSKPVPAIPPELLCSLCKDVMKDAVISGKCCFRSFCYKCMRDHLLEMKSVCVCGARNIVVDYLIPNLTLRDTINRFMESGIANSRSSQNSNGKSVCEAASAFCSTSKISSTTVPTLAVTEERKRSRIELEDKEMASKQMVEKASIGNAVDESKAAVESTKAKGGVFDEAGRKKKKRKTAEVEYNERHPAPNGYYGYDPNHFYHMPYYNYGYSNGRVMPQNGFYSYQM